MTPKPIPTAPKTKRRAKGEGSIYFDEKRKRYRGLLDLGWIDGRRVRKVVSGKTQQEALRKLADLRRRHAAGLRVDRDQQTVGQFLERWLKWKDAHVRPRTAAGYHTYIEGHAIPALGKIRLTDLHVDDVQRMLDKRADTMKPRSVLHLRNILRGALNDAIKWGELERNVAAHARPPEQKQAPVKPLTTKQARTLLSAMEGHRLERLFRLALSLGMRRSEILGLTWDAVDLRRRKLSVRQGLQWAPKEGFHVQEPKSVRSRREVALPKFAVDLLRAQRKAQIEDRLKAGNLWHDTDYVFTGVWGEPLRPDWVSHTFREVATAAKLPDLTFHGLRHAAATFLLAQGMDLKVIQEVLGHSTYQITADIYGHLLPGVKRSAARAMDNALATILATSPGKPRDGK